MASRYASQRSPIVPGAMLLRAIPTMAVVRHGDDHFPELLPGITLVSAQSQHDDALLMIDEALAAAHGGPSALYAKARAALRTRPVDLAPTGDARNGSATVWAVSGDEFISGRLGLITTCLPEPWRGSLPATGVVLAVPRAGLMLVHVPTGDGLARALGTMSSRARNEYDDGADPLSPFLYYISAQGLSQQLSEYGPDGARLIIQGPFRRVYEHFSAGHSVRRTD
ncbi:hypothetical protein [uncultured Propionibacterium sp.]|uniref:hypothetical protein n=1 Tax=uncultured Propionibacterium sp. TaxID=218066 RepID=UPI0029306343|nr:hypothetical protein [uncultured Propionibacterium sp.]